MVMSSVLYRRARISTLAGIVGISATIVVALSSPAEAARRKHRRVSGGYAPPYAAMVVDAKTGRVLHAQNEDAPRHPASVTKVMTLYLLFEQLEKGRIALDTPLQVSANASRQAPSKLGLRPGSTIEVEDAIKALVTKSANDIAVVVAENLGGSEEAFAEQMTRKARSLGMTRTVYRNASGLPDPEQITTARDLTILGRAIQERFPKQYRYFQTRVFHYAGQSHRNHNKLLGRVEGVDGIKTGFTRASGFNLLTSAKDGERHIVAAILGGRSGGSRDAAMAALVNANLPRAYAGARTAPMIAEASERPRPAVISEATRRPEPQVDSTATVQAPGRAKPQPLDTTTRPIVATTTPTSLRWSVGPQPVPQAAQAYAPVESAIEPPARPQELAQPLAQAAPQPLAAAPPAPAPKIEARLPDIVVARPEPAAKVEVAARPDATARPEPVEPPRREAHRSFQMTRWVIQLGAPEDEGKARELLEEARQAARGVLAKAAPFTEKVVRDGATLYRARFSGFDEADDAQEACKSLKRSGFACFATRS
jgi:D-alanyl-D-alanine carboxypeptidase